MKHIPTYSFKFNPVAVGLALGVIKVTADITYGIALWGAKQLNDFLDKKVEEKKAREKAEETKDE